MDKKFGIRLAALLLALLLTCVGCGTKPADPTGTPTEAAKPSAPATEPTPTETEPPTQPEPTQSEPAPTEAPKPTEPVPGELRNLVIDAYAFEIEYTDDCGNTYPVNFHIPKISLPGQEIDAVNTEIWKAVYDDMVKQAEDDMKHSCSLYCFRVSYQWAVNEAILSLCVKMETDVGWDQYLVYNVNVDTGLPVTSVELAELQGIHEAEYRNVIASALEYYFGECYGSAGGDDAFYQEQLERTVGLENVMESSIYLDSAGQMRLVAKVYSLAGAEYYWQDIEL